MCKEVGEEDVSSAVLLYVHVNVGDGRVEVTPQTPCDDTWSANIDCVGCYGLLKRRRDAKSAQYRRRPEEYVGRGQA